MISWLRVLLKKYDFTRKVPITAKGKLTGAAFVAFASDADCRKAWDVAVRRMGLKVEDRTGRA